MKRFHWVVPVAFFVILFLGVPFVGNLAREVISYLAFGAYAVWVVIILWKGGEQRWRTVNLLFVCLFVGFAGLLICYLVIDTAHWQAWGNTTRKWLSGSVLALMLILGVCQEVRQKLRAKRHKSSA